MIRVLHLLGATADFQTRRTHENLRENLGNEFSIESKILGLGGDYHNPVSAIRKLRHATPDIIHAWGFPALTVAALSGAKRIIYTPDGFASHNTLRWVRSITGYFNVQMICPTATQLRVALQNGIMRSRCHVILPGVDFNAIKTPRDPALRASLGLTDDDFVLLAPGESTRSAAHDDAIWAVGILHVLDPRYKLLIWGRGEHATAAIEMVRKIKQPNMMKVAAHQLDRPLEFEGLLPAADCCLITAKAPVSTLPIAMCMAAGLPIVSTVTPTVAELLEDRRTALMVPQTSPRQLAQRILDLRADSNLQSSIADIARAKAHELFSLTRMLNQHRDAYQQFANDDPINITKNSPARAAVLSL